MSVYLIQLASEAHLTTHKYSHVNHPNDSSVTGPLTVAAAVAVLLVVVGNLDSQHKLQLHNYTY